MFKQNWGKSKESLKKLETARSRGVEVTFDQYPDIAGSTMLDAILPPLSLEGGIEKMLSRIENSSTRKKLNTIAKRIPLNSGQIIIRVADKEVL